MWWMYYGGASFEMEGWEGVGEKLFIVLCILVIFFESWEIVGREM